MEQCKQRGQILHDMDISSAGRHTLLVDDILDTGKTLWVIDALIRGRDAASVASAVLLDKPSRRKVAYEADYVGFEIPDLWVQGYGMDSDEIGRAGQDIIKGPYLV